MEDNCIDLAVSLAFKDGKSQIPSVTWKTANCFTTKSLIKSEKQIFFFHSGPFSPFVCDDGMRAPHGCGKTIIFSLFLLFVCFSSLCSRTSTCTAKVSGVSGPNLNEDHTLLPRT